MLRTPNSTYQRLQIPATDTIPAPFDTFDDACRARARGRLAGERGETPFDLDAAGSCLHLRNAVCWRLRIIAEQTVAKCLVN